MTTTVRDGRAVPTELAGRWELIVAEAAKRLFAKRKQVLETIGARQYQGLPVSNDKAFARWVQSRQDPETLIKILTDNAKFSDDNRMLFSRALVNKMVELEGLFKKGTQTEMLPPLAESTPLDSVGEGMTNGIS